jgi:hypothetical protein
MAKGGGERPTVVAKGEGGDELLRVVANGQRWWRRARVVAKERLMATNGQLRQGMVSRSSKWLMVVANGQQQ